jgi:hypothetical protein
MRLCEFSDGVLLVLLILGLASGFEAQLHRNLDGFHEDFVLDSKQK